MQVLRGGPAAVIATASLIRALAAERGADFMSALLQRGAAALLDHMLQHPLAVAGAGEGDVAALQQNALVRFVRFTKSLQCCERLLPVRLPDRSHFALG